LVVWRHGQTAHNAEGRIQGGIDIPLDATGLMQAKVAADQLVQLGPSLIVSSDLSRAYATAQQLAELSGLSIRTDPRLRERHFGQWEGLAISELQASWPAEFARWREGEDIVAVGMETRSATAARVGAALRAAADAGPGDLVVVVTHGGATVCGLTDLLGLDAQHWLGLKVMRNARWAVLERGRRQPEWRLVGYDLGNLEAAPDGTPWASITE
jgi:probable phosphoglycerate mutase